MGSLAQEQDGSRELVADPKPLQDCLQGEEAEESGNAKPVAAGEGGVPGKPVPAQLWSSLPGSKHPIWEDT